MSQEAINRMRHHVNQLDLELDNLRLEPTTPIIDEPAEPDTPLIPGKNIDPRNFLSKQKSYDPSKLDNAWAVEELMNFAKSLDNNRGTCFLDVKGFRSSIALHIETGRHYYGGSIHHTVFKPALNEATRESFFNDSGMFKIGGRFNDGVPFDFAHGVGLTNVSVEDMPVGKNAYEIYKLGQGSQVGNLKAARIRGKAYAALPVSGAGSIPLELQGEIDAFDVDTAFYTHNQRDCAVKLNSFTADNAKQVFDWVGGNPNSSLEIGLAKIEHLDGFEYPINSLFKFTDPNDMAVMIHHLNHYKQYPLQANASLFELVRSKGSSAIRLGIGMAAQKQYNEDLHSQEHYPYLFKTATASQALPADFYRKMYQSYEF